MTLEPPESIARVAELVRGVLRERQCATPFLLLDTNELDRALARFEDNLPGVRLHYAVKANPTPALVQFFHARGLSFDVASAGEVSAVMGVGVAPSRLFLSTPIKTPATLATLFAQGIPACAVDTEAEIHRLVLTADRLNSPHRPSIFLRIRVESSHVEVDLNRKFGCSTAEALRIIECAVANNLSVQGVCFHVGTQSTSADNYFLGIEGAMLVAREAERRFAVRPSILNIGGGFCTERAAQRAGITLSSFYKKVGEACRVAQENGFELYAEPGRALVDSAGIVVTSVIGTEVRDGRQWLYLDDGIYGNYSIKLYESHEFEFYRLHPLRGVLSGIERGQNAHWIVAGPTCDSLDVIAENVSIPGPVRCGDVFFSPNMGAYTVATAGSFNGFAVPACVLARRVGGRGRVSVEVYQGDAEPREARSGASHSLARR